MGIRYPYEYGYVCEFVSMCFLMDIIYLDRYKYGLVIIC